LVEDRVKAGTVENTRRDRVGVVGLNGAIAPQRYLLGHGLECNVQIHASARSVIPDNGIICIPAIFQETRIASVNRGRRHWKYFAVPLEICRIFLMSLAG
jgi:hypothetical protein